jgi:hypothetical protein
MGDEAGLLEEQEAQLLLEQEEAQLLLEQQAAMRL